MDNVISIYDSYVYGENGNAPGYGRLREKGYGSGCGYKDKAGYGIGDCLLHQEGWGDTRNFFILAGSFCYGYGHGYGK
jgi:hypothetical protein